MNEVERLTVELSRAIKESSVYAAYAEAYRALSQYPGLLREINELRRENFKLQNSDDAEGMFDHVESFRKRYAELRKHQAVNDFLKAELCLSRMIQSIGNSIVSEIDFDMSFLEDCDGR